MKIDEKYLKFPNSLPNDLESFANFYPKKFPPIVDYYEKVANEIVYSPEKFREYGNWSQKELFEGFNKIKQDYENGNKDDLEFLVEIDQRLQKLICYRFWIVNYIFPDGPIHSFFVNEIKRLVYKIVDVGVDVEDFENSVVLIQRDLMQTDYADLYLQDSLGGKNILKLLSDNPELKIFFDRAVCLIDEDSEGNEDEINSIWDEVYCLIEKKDLQDLKKELFTSIEQAEMRGIKLPIYNALTHAVEFRNENSFLEERHRLMNKRIDEIKMLAKEKLSSDEYELFDLSYEQIRNFAMFKDIMGEIDPVLLPWWLGDIQVKIREILKESGVEFQDQPTGHAGMFYFFVWHLPDVLKAKVMTPDSTPFSLETL